jgi:alpha-beta hydrolase superfamily lysophospholipase
VVASALGHSSPAVTHAHYIDGATARRARTRRVIGKVAPDPALRVVGATPSPAATRATRVPRMPAKRTTRREAPDTAVRVVGSDATVEVGPTAEPTGSPQMLGNG